MAIERVTCDDLRRGAFVTWNVCTDGHWSAGTRSV